MVRWVRVNGAYYLVSKVLCTQKQLKLFLRRDSSMHHLRFGKPHYSFVLDDVLVTDVVLSPDLKVALLQGCPRWYLESVESEKEN